MRNYKKTKLKGNPAINFKTILFFLTIPFCFFQPAYGFSTTEEISNQSFITKKANNLNDMATPIGISMTDNASTKTNAFYFLARRIYSPGSRIGSSYSPGAKPNFNGNENYAGMQMVGATNAAGRNAIAIGDGNVASGDYSTAIGGRGNTATNTYATSIGSYLQASNKGATGYHSGIYSAYNGLASNSYSIVVGGFNSTSSGYGSVVIGGKNGKATGVYSAVISSPDSSSTGRQSGIFAGQNHKASGDHSTVIAGKYNTASGYNSVVVGGGAPYASTNGNIASGTSSTVIGGQANKATGQYSGVLAGKDNTAAGDNSVVIGGGMPLASVVAGNVAGADQSVIVGGSSNNIDSQATNSSIFSGTGNTVLTGTSSAILGGRNNKIKNSYAAILAGDNNQVNALYSVAAGINNVVNGKYSMVVGANNTSSYDYQFIAGEDNLVNQPHAVALGKFSDPGQQGDWGNYRYAFVIGNGTAKNQRANIFSVTKAGNVFHTGSYSSSDKRLKTNFKPYKAGLKEILALNPVHFTWKRWQTQTVGLIAQDVYKVLPDLVHKGDDDENAKDWTEIKEQWSMSYDKIPLALINATKEQQAIIDKQLEEMQSYQKAIEKIEAEIKRLKSEKTQ